MLRTHSISAGRFWSPELAAEVRRAAAEGPVDLVQVEYLQMVPVAPVPGARRVLDLHNVESALVRSYARAGAGTGRPRGPRRGAGPARPWSAGSLPASTRCWW